MSEVVKLNKDKISKEELTKLQEAVNKVTGFQMQIGGLEAQKHELLHSIAEASGELGAVQKELEAEYGPVSVDINTGEIKTVESNQKN